MILYILQETCNTILLYISDSIVCILKNDNKFGVFEALFFLYLPSSGTQIQKYSKPWIFEFLRKYVN